MKNSDFDLDLTVGKVGEEYVSSLLGMDTVEVKRDLKWFKTENLYIEYSCYSTLQGTYVASGISITKATHWAFVLGDSVVIVPTSHIKGIIELNSKINMLREVPCNIPPNPSKGYLITINDLMTYQKYKGAEMEVQDV